MDEQTKLLYWFFASGLGLIVFNLDLQTSIWFLFMLCYLIYTFVVYRIGFLVGYNNNG